MKRFYFIATLLLFSAITFAQTDKGRFTVSGRSSIDFSYSNTRFKGGSVSSDTETGDTYNFNIAPAFGYFVFNDFAVTLQTAYAISDGNTYNQMSQFGIIPGAIYYIPTGSIVRPFAQVGGGYMNINTKVPLESGGKATHSFNGYTLAGGIGVAFFVKENIAIELSGQYATVKTSFSGDSSIKMNLDGFSGSIGFSLFF
ncbi:MAG: outer membrane beta-barrel protein [Petrimonas sp.]|jgi:outer membrane protein W